MITLGVLNLLATVTAATPKITKLYGQMIPKIKSGGCQLGAFNDRYQLLPVVVHLAAPIAYRKTKPTPAKLATL